jgi:D-3-phosphoglycerate dehydrogenase
MKILVSDNVAQQCIDILAHEEFDVDNRPGLSADELMAIIPSYDALVVRSATRVTADVIARGTALKVIGRAGTGVDNIDVAAATRRGILVMNTPGGNTVSAAEHTVALLLSLARNIPQAYASLRRGEWERARYTGTEVAEKTVGVVGLGKIGREVAIRCHGLGMRVIGYDPVLGPDVAAGLKVELVGLDELFRRSDFITVHTPLTAETRGLLNDETFGRCKKGVRVVNCARGGIIDEGALLRALKSGRVAGAALDVFEKEPPQNNPLLAHPQVIATPHLGASTEEAQEKVAVHIAHQVADALVGRAFAGVVNATDMHMTLQKELRPFVGLAEKLGSCIAQLAPGTMDGITIAIAGPLLLPSFDLMKAGVLKGILALSVPEPVNFINAPFLAAEMGIAITEQRESEGAINTIRVRRGSGSEAREIVGTVYGSDAPRLVAMDGLRCEVRPEGILLIYYNTDRPGMLANVGSVLARYGVNIGDVSLGRSAGGKEALTIMNIDSDIPAGVREELGRIEGVSRLRVVAL